MADRSIEILLKARNEAVVEIERTRRSLRDLDREINRANGTARGGGAGGTRDGGIKLINTNTLTQGISVMAAFQTGARVLIAMTRALRGDWEGVVQSLEQLPLGLGSMIRAGRELSEELTNAAEKSKIIAATLAGQEGARRLSVLADASITMFDDLIGRLEREARLAGLSGEDRAREAAQQRFEETMQRARESAERARKEAIEERRKVVFGQLGLRDEHGNVIQDEKSLSAAREKTQKAIEEARTFIDVASRNLGSETFGRTAQVGIRRQIEERRHELEELERLMKAIEAAEDGLSRGLDDVNRNVEDGLSRVEEAARRLRDAEIEHSRSPGRATGIRGRFERLLGTGRASADASGASPIERDTRKTADATAKQVPLMERMAAALDRIEQRSSSQSIVVVRIA